MRLDTLTCADATWCQSRKRSPRSPDLTPVGPGFVLYGGARLHGVATRRRDRESNWENPTGHSLWLVTGRRTAQGEAA